MRWACVGFGNVGQAIVSKLTNENTPPQQILVRTINKNLQGFTNSCFIDTYELLHPDLEFVLLCVPDKTIEEVAKQIVNGLPEVTVVHTSGTVSLEKLTQHTMRCGVIYPLQTFSVGFQPDWVEVPVLLEATEKARPIIRHFAQQLVKEPIWVTSEDRATIHLGAVWAANFVNLMAWIADDIIEPTGNSYRLYLPLMRQVIEKLTALSPKLAQTGPAKRNDTTTIQQHLELLTKRYPEVASIYRELSHQIQKKTSP